MHRRVSPVTPEMMSIINRNGGLDNIKPELLRQLGLVRLHDPIRKVSAVYSSLEYGRLVAQAKATMRDYRGYIFAHDLNRMYGLLTGQHMITREEMGGAKRRAQRFIEAGIPPIFEESFYDKTTFVYYARLPRVGGAIEVRYPSLFPSIDFIIQYSAGTYERNCAYMGITLKQHGERSKIEIKRASIEEVTRFRMIAFTEEGKIEPLLIREIDDYVRKHFDIFNEAREQEIGDHNALTFLFLEEALHGLPHTPRTFELWNGDIHVVHERRWYLRFRPSERELIVQAYLQSLQGSPTIERDVRTFERLQTLFPELCAVVQSNLRMKDLVSEYTALTEILREAQQSGDLSKVPEKTLYREPWRSSLLPALKEIFRASCRKLAAEKPFSLLAGITEFHLHLRIPRHLPFLPEFKEIIDEERLRVVRNLSDDEFKGFYCGARANRRGTVGQTRSDRTNEAGQKLKEFILQRAAVLAAKEAEPQGPTEKQTPE